MAIRVSWSSHNLCSIGSDLGDAVRVSGFGRFSQTILVAGDRIGRRTRRIACVHGSEVDGTGCMALLKRVPDDERRAVVAQVGALIERRTGQRVAERQLTTDELRGWIAGGNSVGSHTWDHPSLRMCTRQEQATQIAA